MYRRSRRGTAFCRTRLILACAYIDFGTEFASVVGCQGSALASGKFNFELNGYAA
jgi:hypothetical protein